MNSLKAAIAVCIAMSASGAWADLKKSETGNDVCSPKVHFKIPDGWLNAYLVLGDTSIAFPKAKLADNGWTSLDLGSIKTIESTYFYINSVNTNSCFDGKCFTKNGVNVKPAAPQTDSFTCKDIKTDGGDIWIQEHPDPKKEGQVYVTTTKPNVKEFHVFVPNNMVWNSAVPMINEDGKSRTLDIDPEHCGWYFRRYIDEKLPTSVIIYRDDDIELNGAIGMGGEKDLNEYIAADPIMLADLFELFKLDPDYHEALYFVADEKEADMLPSDTYGWSAKRSSSAVGNCQYVLATTIYDTDAQLHPSFSCWAEGASVKGDGCQAANGTAAQDVDKETALKAIYDCMGVTTGIVESTLDPTTKKPKLSTAGKKCFIDEKYFNQLFNYTEGVNEISCFDTPFTRSKDGKWEFDSDYYFSPGLKTPVMGGFYPVEATTDAIVKAVDQNQKPAPLARTKHNAEGPVFWGPELRKYDPTEQVPIIDIFCNGAGWTKGHDCESLFADGEKTETYVKEKLNLDSRACVFGWSCDLKSSAPEGWQFYASGTETIDARMGTQTSRWVSEVGGNGNGGRNQHFCTESHSNFRYKKGLKFSFRGSDDLWVFIDNKLAVDLGGNHLPAPGYVDVDKFLPNGEVGRAYDIDIFSCNRRSTSNSLRIKTNMFIEQASGITIEQKYACELCTWIEKDIRFNLCYQKTGNGSCTAKRRCGKDITDKISYILTKEKTGLDPTQIIIGEKDFEANPKQFCSGNTCGIDVSAPYSPIINEDQLENALNAGKYYLVVKIGSDTKAIEIKIKAYISIANREAIVVDREGKKGVVHAFKSQAMATPKLDIAQMVPLYIASIIDPCMTINCTEPLEMLPAAKAPYTLQVSNKKAQFYKMKDGKLSQVDFVKDGTTIGQGGIDTIYVTIPYDDMEAIEERVSINVKGSSRKAEISFFVPQLAIVDSDSTYNVLSGDKDPDKPRIKGGIYPFYIVALRADYTPCTECNFPLFKGSKTSAGLDVVVNSGVVNGRATVAIQSSKVYEKANGGTATLHVIGPNAALTYATYSNMQFAEPPASIPQSDKFINSPSFGVKVVAPLEISITINKFTKEATQQYAIMDMKGQVITDGTLNSSATRVKVPTKGSYIVKVGTDYNRVNVK